MGLDRWTEPWISLNKGTIPLEAIALPGLWFYFCFASANSLRPSGTLPQGMTIVDASPRVPAICSFEPQTKSFGSKGAEEKIWKSFSRFLQDLRFGGSRLPCSIRALSGWDVPSPAVICLISGGMSQGWQVLPCYCERLASPCQFP